MNLKADIFRKSIFFKQLFKDIKSILGAIENKNLLLLSYCH